MSSLTATLRGVRALSARLGFRGRWPASSERPPPFEKTPRSLHFTPRRSRPSGTRRQPPTSARRAAHRRGSLSTERAFRRWPSRHSCLVDGSGPRRVSLAFRPSFDRKAGALSTHARPDGERGERERETPRGWVGRRRNAHSNLLFLLSIALETTKRNRGRGIAGFFFWGRICACCADFGAGAEELEMSGLRLKRTAVCQVAHDN